MKHLVSGIMLLSLLGLFSCKAQNVNNLSVEAFAEALAPETRILDVRTAEEFAAGHLRGAVNVDWFGNFLEDVYNMLGGYLAWTEAGREVVREAI